MRALRGRGFSRFDVRYHETWRKACKASKAFLLLLLFLLVRYPMRDGCSWRAMWHALGALSLSLWKSPCLCTCSRLPIYTSSYLLPTATTRGLLQPACTGHTLSRPGARGCRDPAGHHDGQRMAGQHGHSCRGHGMDQGAHGSEQVEGGGTVASPEVTDTSPTSLESLEPLEALASQCRSKPPSPHRRRPLCLDSSSTPPSAASPCSRPSSPRPSRPPRPRVLQEASSCMATRRPPAQPR